MKPGATENFCFWKSNDKRQRHKSISVCDWCLAEFKHTKSKKRRFCSPACQDEVMGGPLPIRLGRLIKRGDFDECWPWKGTRNKGGYGQISVDGQTRLAHRVAYETFIGPIPKGMMILHSCDNPRCCNYMSHHRIGTHEDNMRDLAERNRGSASKTSWLERIELVREARAGELLENLSLKYRISQASCARWVRLFAEGKVFGFDQFLD